MESKISIEEYLKNNESEHIIQKKKSQITGIIIMILGVVFIILDKIFFNNSNSMLDPLLITLTIVFFIWGALLIAMRKKIFISKSSRGKLIFTDFFYDSNERDKLVKMADSNHFSDLNKLKTSDHETLKLRVAYLSDKSLAYVQVLSYVPYEYVMATEVIKVDPDQIGFLPSK